jgi:CO dehydrogenase maturation factor
MFFDQFVLRERTDMKIAVSGKGGVGKTTFAANLARWLAGQGHNVLAVDADPDVSLGAILGIPESELSSLKALVEMKELIDERMGGSGAYYSLNPKVDDVLEDYSLTYGNIRLLRMGNVKSGGTACYCRENTFLQALLNSLILDKEDTVILDLGAGIEQLTRGTARGVDILVIVSEPSRVSIQTTKVIRKLAFDLGIPRVVIIGSKARNIREENMLRESFSPEELIGIIPYSEELLEMSLNNDDPKIPSGLLGRQLAEIYQRIVS